MSILTSQTTELFEVAPFVLVVDRSESMECVINVVNGFVPELIETIEQTPEARESVALGLIAFNDSAQIVRRLTWIDEEGTRPRFVAERTTSYKKPLEYVHRMIETETAALAARGFRPVIFFITDAQPNVESEEEWLAARTELLASPLRPKLVALGFGEVNEATLRTLASDPKLAHFNGEGARSAIDEILNVVMSTVITLTTDGRAAPADSLAARIIASERDPRDGDTITYRG